MTGLDYAIILSFLTVLALAGLGISRLIRTSDDFFVASRELTPFILCATLVATNLSMFHFVGMGGIAYKSGLSVIWQNWTGDMALVISGMFILPAMRRLRVRSVPEFLQIRYGRWLRVLVGAFWGVRLCLFLGLILYIAASAAMIITGWNNYAAWLLVFSIVSILYSAIGGAWAVAIMDSVQFLVMVLGALIVLPIAMHAAGGLPALMQWLRSTGHENHLRFVPTTGEFNWVFVLAFVLLSMKWASIDQAILQRAFGARSPRIGAKGMVLAGLITTPFAFFWILPGLAMSRIHPGIANPDHAIPNLLSQCLPAVSRGLLGIVLCGLVAAQISVITADINSVATLFTSDVYRNLRRKEPTQRQLLIVVRISSVICGALMLAAAYLMSYSVAGAVRLNQTIVGILDMPLFVITIVYGLFWRRTNWQGATAGFLLGGVMGALCYVLLDPSCNAYAQRKLSLISSTLAAQVGNWHTRLEIYARWLRSIAPIVSASTALLVTPLVSLLTKRPAAGGSEEIWTSFKPGQEPDEERDTFHFVPKSVAGRFGFAMVILGFLGFLAGVACAAVGLSIADPLSVGGMIVVFVGGLMRVYSD